MTLSLKGSSLLRSKLGSRRHSSQLCDNRQAYNCLAKLHRAGLQLVHNTSKTILPVTPAACICCIRHALENIQNSGQADSAAKTISYTTGHRVNVTERT